MSAELLGEPFLTSAQGYLEADVCLALEDGRVFLGRSFGSRGTADGEIVFNTSMAGYQEIVTDPSYRGQMVVLTHPQIGNYGVQGEAAESKQPWITALVVRDLARQPNHWLATTTLEAYLERAGVPGIQGVDTRALTKHLRVKGTMRAAIAPIQTKQPLGPQIARAVQQAMNAVPLSEKNLVAEVSDPLSVGERSQRSVAGGGRVGVRRRIVLVDCGVKHHIARSLEAQSAEVIPVSWRAGIDEVMAINPRGVVVSNGPGDPERMLAAAALVNDLMGRGVPTMGICLGHQIIGLAAGGATSRLRFGHHGGNHPVRDLASGRIHITSQNHEFQVEAGSIQESPGFFVSMVNLNDGSVEGLAHRHLPIFSVQYHPEGCPGPQDNQYLFERFLAMVERPVAGALALSQELRGPTSAAVGSSEASA